MGVAQWLMRFIKDESNKRAALLRITLHARHDERSPLVGIRAIARDSFDLVFLFRSAFHQTLRITSFVGHHRDGSGSFVHRRNGSPNARRSEARGVRRDGVELP